MKKNLLLLLLFFGFQVLNAQNIRRADVEAYVKCQYGTSWKEVSLYLANKDVLDKDNALCFDRTMQLPGKNKAEIFIDLNYWFLKTFSNASSKIELADKDLGVIMARGYLPGIAYHSGGVSSYCVNIRPIVKCDIRDGQVKVTVTIPNYEVTRVDDGIWSAMLDADYDKHPPYTVDETWSLNLCFPFAKKDFAKKTSSKAFVMTHGYAEVLLNDIQSKLAVPQKKQAIEMVVHRGANALAPENTIASADSALAHGSKWIEVDVRRSKDGVLFNLHDETLDRTTNGKGKLSSMKSKDVRKLDAGSWFSLKYKGTPIPTIAEMLDHLDDKANVFFDVKRGTPVDSLIKLVREKGYSAKSFFWFADEEMLRQMVEYASDLKIKVNASDINRLKYWQKICYPSYVEIAPQYITPQFLSYCHLYNIKVMAACQEDDTSQFQQVLDSGADLVNLDRPEVFEKLMKKAQ